MNKKTLQDDFVRAVEQLGLVLKLKADTDVMKAGCIQYFEFSFELAWKTIKSHAEDQGVLDCNSPKSALKYAFKNGWLEEDDIWLDMLASRNKMAHTYNAKSALNVYERLPPYYIALKALAATLVKIV